MHVHEHENSKIPPSHMYLYESHSFIYRSFQKEIIFYSALLSLTAHDCYKLVSMGEKTSSTTVIIPTTTTPAAYESLFV